jgi:stearoyl-CoA desaturase (delta-9 desaturase)
LQQRPTKWIRNHRTHHRYTDTNADPHNAKRGFFFSHIGWVMMKHHPAVKEYGKYVDVSDLAKDPVIRFADKHFALLMITLTFIFPFLLPIYGWNESWTVALTAVFFRYLWVLHATCSVNSFAHIWGYRPYDRAIEPKENLMVSMFAFGEGWHNYHHCFPWDYKASEYGLFNPATTFINLMAWLGLAYNLKTPSEKIVQKYCVNKGDGTSCPIMTKCQS